MVDEREDLIEAIKRRNEERARRLRERIAKGEFDKFETPFEAVDDVLPTGPETIAAPESEFDLSSFPPPPEPAAFTLDESRVAPRGLELPPPPALELEPPSAPPVFDMGPPPAFAEGPEIAPPAPPLTGVIGEETFAGLELTALDLEGMGDFLAPQTWEGAEAPTAAAPEPIAPPPAFAPPTAPPEFTPGLEIEVEPVGAPPEMELPAPPPFEEVAVAAAPPAPRFPAPEEVPAFAEPKLREEEAEAIKSTIERELREMEPAAPPMPPRPAAPVAPEIPVTVTAPPAPAPVAEVVAPFTPVIAAAPVAAAPPEIFIGIEVRGTKVRIERRNITLAAAVELFQAIINRYESR